MSYLTENIPYFRCYVRNEFLYNHTKGTGEYTEGEVFGVDSVLNRALGWHVMLETGAVFWRLPLHALCWKKDVERPLLSDAQMFDNISRYISVTTFDFLKYRTGTVKLRSGKIVLFEYMFTVDYAESPYGESPQDHKCSHILKLQNGNFASMPNNRILWDYLDKTDKKPDYLTNQTVHICERGFVVKDGDSMFYDVDEDKS